MKRICEFLPGKNLLAASAVEEVIDTESKPPNPVDWAEHLFRVCVCVFVCERQRKREKWREAFTS